MKGYDLLDAVGGIDAKFVENASQEKSSAERKKKKEKWYPWAALAACLCLVVFAGILFPRLPHPTPADVSEPAGTGLRVQTPGDTAVPAVPSAPTAEGVWIPSLELPENTGNVQTDMIGLVVYNGGCYTQAEDYYGEDARRIDSLVGELLGYASGNIDEWSKQEAYEQEFASTIPGEVYAVNGYDTDFRICIRQEVEDANGETTLWIQFLDRLNGITLTAGEDLFESRLHIRERTGNIQWQSHDDWDSGGSDLRDADLDPALWEEFLAQADRGEFFSAWDPGCSAANPAGGKASVYDTLDQAHLVLTMTDGTSVRLRLIAGGYVGYDALGWYFVRIPGEAFDAVYDACGGTHTGGVRTGR